MSLVEVTMYRVVCDHEGCDASPQDESESYAWLDRGYAEDEAVNCEWYVGAEGHLCEEHTPRCMADGCRIVLGDDDFGLFCEDHAEEDDAPVSHD